MNIRFFKISLRASSTTLTFFNHNQIRINELKLSKIQIFKTNTCCLSMRIQMKMTFLQSLEIFSNGGNYLWVLKKLKFAYTFLLLFLFFFLINIKSTTKTSKHFIFYILYSKLLTVTYQGNNQSSSQQYVNYFSSPFLFFL